MTIGQASLDHIEVVLPLFDSYRQFYDQPPAVEQARRFLTGRLTSNESVVFLALSGDVGVGFTQLYPSFRLSR